MWFQFQVRLRAYRNRSNTALTPGGTVQSRSPVDLDIAVTTQPDQRWLAVAAEGAGSFCLWQHLSCNGELGTLAEGDYTGQVVTSKSPVATENRTIPAALKITSFPQFGNHAGGILAVL